ncbi:MAG TPA: hypothetical protein H9744_04845, partial [Candidatus Eisenbergiella stercoravium]|nr:hypothetical protein [Candidatus Eisenbergiella stercoravium]
MLGKAKAKSKNDRKEGVKGLTKYLWKGMSHEEVNSSCDIPLFCCLFQRNIQMIRLFLTFCLKKRRPPLP